MTHVVARWPLPSTSTTAGVVISALRDNKEMALKKIRCEDKAFKKSSNATSLCQLYSAIVLLSKLYCRSVIMWHISQILCVMPVAQILARQILSYKTHFPSPPNPKSQKCAE